MSETTTLVSLSGVAVRAGSIPILRDINLSVGPGEAVGLFGANGAGKTTLLRLIATMTRPSHGTGSVFGADLNSPDRFQVRSRIGYIGHTPGWYPELTLFENLSFIADAMGIADADVDAWLAAVGLGAARDRRADRCSHGMQRRAEFARVLMTEPDLLLLDEPHSALDADAVNLVDRLVHRTVERGGAAVLVSHDHTRVRGLADRILTIENGTIAGGDRT
ncbi:MAG: heme ABC exporter ATP-binding protein CcmA [Acidimicrobiia bacterium]